MPAHESARTHLAGATVVRGEALGRDDLQHLVASVGHGQEVDLLLRRFVQQRLDHREHRVEEGWSVQYHDLFVTQRV